MLSLCSNTIGGTMTIPDELKAMGAHLTEALGARDATAVASVYDDEALLLLHGMPIVRGKQAIFDLTKETFAAQEGTPRQPYSQACTEFWEAGDKVIEIGTY